MTYWVAVGLLVGALVGCGIQGPPVPPEDVGIAGMMHRQKELKGKEEAKRPMEESQRAPEPTAGQEAEAPPDTFPFEGAMSPSARPSGDVPLKPR